jgi:hypothetical protein
MLCQTSMSEQNSRPSNKAMPQIDFRQAFVSADQEASPADFAQSNQANRAGDKVEQRAATRSTGTNPLNRSNWANITFVAVTFTGGLFCAFYFFNGAELLRVAAAWPREFLYSQPFGIVGNGKIDKSHGADDPTSPFGPDSPASSKADPFRKVGFPGLNPPPNSFASSPAAVSSPSNASISPSAPPLSPPPFNPGPLLGGLNPFPAGTDALSQAFNKAVSDLQRISNLDARRTIVVVETAPSAARMRAAKAAQNAKRAAQNAVANVAAATGRTAQTLQQTSQSITATTQNQAASAQNQVASTTQSTSGMAQQTLGGVRGAAGGALSGLGGLHVGGGGALGGGGVHLGGGGHH